MAGTLSTARSSRALASLGPQRFSTQDLWGAGILVVLPLLIFGLPALLGHPVVFGDDFSQNLPLRQLVGIQVRHGHLPLYDPYIWSGAPLLGGWNAGAAYPFTYLFVFLPTSAAWTLNLLATWWVAALGSFAFLRASRLGAAASLLGTLSFAFAGAMTAQVVHFGIVAGTSWAPVALLAVLMLSRDAESDLLSPQRYFTASRLRWCAVLGASGAMAVLAGEPRAITNVVIIVGIYILWRAVRLGRDAGPFLVACLLAAVLAVGISTVQWLPGLHAVNSSQRATKNADLFGSGSLPVRWLLLLFVPDLLGGSGSLGQPPFLAPYNLTEVAGYVGLMPLVASVGLLAKLQLKRPLPEWIIWQFIALVGILLALGNSTPLWHLLIRIPFFGGERLQSRNLLIADVAFAFLLAYWADDWLKVASTTTARRRRRSRRLRVGRGFAGSLPAWAAIATVIVAFAWGAGFLRWMGVSPSSATEAGGLRLWFLPFGILGVGAVLMLARGPTLSRATRVRLLSVFVLVDIITYTVMAVVAVGAGFASTSQTSASQPPHSGPPTTGATLNPTTSMGVPLAGASVPSPSTQVSAKPFVGNGRFVIYDPDQLDQTGLNALGAPDANVLTSTPSAQGYGSIVAGSYATATGTHQATGAGQNILDPAALSNGVFSSLSTTVLFAPRDYFLVQESSSELATPVPGAGTRHISAGGRATWYLGANLLVRTMEIEDKNAASDIRSGLSFALVAPNGGSISPSSLSVKGSDQIDVSFAPARAAIALSATAATTKTSLGAPVVTTADGTVYSADGQLQDAVVPPNWNLRAINGSFGVYENSSPAAPITVRATGGGSATARLQGSSSAFGASTTVQVSSTRGAEVVRSVAAIPGWKASWTPTHRSGHVQLSVQTDGIVQLVKVPPGSGSLTWRYVPPGWRVGWVASAVATFALVVLIAWSFLIRRRQLRSTRFTTAYKS